MKASRPRAGCWESESADFERGARAHDPRFGRLRRSSEEIRRKNLFDGFDQVSTPFRENRGNLIVIFFRDEIVEPGVGLEQRGVQRRLGAVMRMQMESGVDNGAF
jgi:hypothetical protein